jgi:hypothetical protein
LGAEINSIPATIIAIPRGIWISFISTVLAYESIERGLSPLGILFSCVFISRLDNHATNRQEAVSLGPLSAIQH